MNKTNRIYLLLLLTVIAFPAQSFGSAPKDKKASTDTIYTNISGQGNELIFIIKKGKYHNHPTMAIWLEDLKGHYLQPLFVTKFFATGIFDHGPLNDTVWGNNPGLAYRPAALPYWNHKRTDQPDMDKLVPNPDNPVPDGYTSATPKADFVLKTRSDISLPDTFRVMLEVNQTWDWNEYWTNNKYPDNIHYKSSSQPSVVYSVIIDLQNPIKEYWLQPVGHGHYSGMDGNLYTNLQTLTTALEILETIKVKVVEKKK